MSKTNVEWDDWKREQDEQAVLRKDDMIAQGLPHVKPELADEWRAYVTKNSDDGYSGAVVRGSVEGLKVLASGGTPKEAEDTACQYAETGFMMGCAAHALSYFSPRGEEFRLHWNSLYMKPEQVAASTGVVNPAILTIKL